MRINKLKTYLINHPAELEIVLFIVFSFFAQISQLVSRIVCDILLINLSNPITFWFFPTQALGSFIAFLISNIIAKVISFVLNRKKTFKANNNTVFSIITYIVLVVLIIAIETVIGTPIQNGLYVFFGGGCVNGIITTSSVTNPTLYQWSGVLSQLIYGVVDGVIIFLMDKFVIMKRKVDNKA